VGAGESFASIAAKTAPKYNLSPAAMARLILLHNFNTTTPNEINFYLEHNLKCSLLTKDRRNYLFSPGQTIYLPPLAASRPELEGTGIWFGIGLQGGGVLIGGAQTLYAYMVSLEAPVARNFILEIGPGGTGWDRLNRLGLGVGGGVGAVLVIIASLFEDPTAELHDLPVGGDVDVNVSLGANWARVIKSAKMARLAPLLKKAAELVRKYPRMDRYLKPEQIETLASAIKDALKTGALSMKTDAHLPVVEVLALPVSTGVELSVGVSWGYCRASNYRDNTGIIWKRPGNNR
jgi:hypothetical protein